MWLEMALAEAPPEDARLHTIINSNLAQAQIDLGNLDRAQELLARGYSLVEPHDLRWTFLLFRKSFNLSMRKSDLDAASGHLHQMIDLAAKLNTFQNWIWTLPAVLQLAAERGDWEGIARTAGALERLRSSHGMSPLPASAADIEARCELGQERYEELAAKGAAVGTHDLCLQIIEALDSGRSIQDRGSATVEHEPDVIPPE